MADFTFSSYEDTKNSVLTGEGETWMEQADTFFLFLLAQGFTLSEKRLATYYKEKAKEMGHLRSNSGRNHE